MPGQTCACYTAEAFPVMRRSRSVPRCFGAVLLLSLAGLGVCLVPLCGGVSLYVVWALLRCAWVAACWQVRGMCVRLATCRPGLRCVVLLPACSWLLELAGARG